MKTIIFLALILALITSCEEVIELDLNSSNPQVVIEANINSATNKAIVNISKSINFDESNSFPKVTDYLVSIKEPNGEILILNEVLPGIYMSDTKNLISGRPYELNIEGEGKSYYSQSTLQQKIEFDSLIVIKNIVSTKGPGSGKNGFNYEIKVRYIDPLNVKNYYRFVISVNGAQTDNNYVFDDRLSDGKNIESVLILDMKNNFQPGDTLSVEMQCIDNSVYEYFKVFGSQLGKFQQGATPANPPSNILGAKLGYFSAHTSEVRSIILP